MSTKSKVTSRSERLNLRSTERQAYLLRTAADAADVTMSEFILNSAVREAERVLAERRWFVVSDEQYQVFLDALEKPVNLEAVKKLYSAPSPFGQEFSLESE